MLPLQLVVCTLLETARGVGITTFVFLQWNSLFSYLLISFYSGSFIRKCTEMVWDVRWYFLKISLDWQEFIIACGGRNYVIAWWSAIFSTCGSCHIRAQEQNLMRFNQRLHVGYFSTEEVLETILFVYSQQIYICG